MENSQLYLVSNQQRFTFNSWRVVVPYSNIQFPVYLTNPYHLTYRMVGYIRGYSYNHTIGGHMLTFDLGRVNSPRLPNLGVYSNEPTLHSSSWWALHPSLNSRVTSDGGYTSCNLPYLPAHKYAPYLNSGNRIFYDLSSHVYNSRYSHRTVRPTLTRGLDTLVSSYTPLTAILLSNPSCTYYLLSPQRYHTLNFTPAGRVKHPALYLRAHLHKWIYTALWSYNFAHLWRELAAFSPADMGGLLEVKGRFIHTIEQYVLNKWLLLLGRGNIPLYSTQVVSSTPYSVVRFPVTQSLAFLSTAQVSIPRKRVIGMGSWGAEYLGYYSTAPTYHAYGTGITFKLPKKKYGKVKGKAYRRKGLWGKLYYRLPLLPSNHNFSPFLRSKVLQVFAGYNYQGLTSMNHLYMTQYPLWCTGWRARVRFTQLFSLYGEQLVRLYRYVVSKYGQIAVTRRYPGSRSKRGGRRKGRRGGMYLTPRIKRLWYNRVLSLSPYVKRSP